MRLALAVAVVVVAMHLADGAHRASVASSHPAHVTRDQPVPGRPDAAPRRFGIGRPATPDEIRAIDIDVMPDGRGLPPGRGSVPEGAKVYAVKCASCHGSSGEGKPFDRLVGRDDGGGFQFANDPRLVRTVGNYWPYATTLYDYTARSMPFLQPGTLTPDETYAVVAYLLFLNDIIPEEAVMERTSLPRVVMPARGRFVLDNRAGGSRVQ